MPALTTPRVVSMSAAAAAVGPRTVFCQLPHLALPKMEFPPTVTLPRFSHVSFHFTLFDKKQLDQCISLCLQNPSFKQIHKLGGNKKIHCLKTCASFLLGKTWSQQRLRSVAKLCLTLCSSVDCSTPGPRSFTISQSLRKLVSIESVTLSESVVFILCCLKPS